MAEDYDKIKTNKQIIHCPECGNKAIRFSVVPTRQGKKQRYRCTECGRTFYEKNMHNKQ